MLERNFHNKIYKDPYSRVPGRNKRPWWKNSEKLLSILVRINVLGGKLWKIKVTPDQNFKQFKLQKKNKSKTSQLLLMSKDRKNIDFFEAKYSINI